MKNFIQTTTKKKRFAVKEDPDHSKKIDIVTRIQAADNKLRRSLLKLKKKKYEDFQKLKQKK